MARKKFTYRGLSQEELQKLPKDEFINLVNARARRTLKRNEEFPQHSQEKLLEKIEKEKEGTKIKLRTHKRDMIVLPEMIGHKIEIYNGKEFLAIEIKPEMVGHYFGEFILTRKKVTHSSPGMGATRSSLYVPLK
jgi:small subunit ribosomal protein S19